MSRLSISLAALLLALPSLGQTTRYVNVENCPGPGSGTAAEPFCKIQDGVDIAVAGDTVLVSPGTYVENVNFQGKEITIKSSDGPSVTMIDGGNVEAVVHFVNNEGPASILEGFTLTNGNENNGDYLHDAG